MWRPHFYVSIKRAEPASFEVIVNHDNITDITTYLRLCSRPHKRRYEAISMMLSWLMHEPHGGSCGWYQARNCSEDESAGSYCSSFSGIWRIASNSVCFGHLIGPFSSGKAISQDFSADEIQAIISSAVAVTNTGSQPMPPSG